MVFSNADKDKLAILDYIKTKAGVYYPHWGSWTNKLNGRKYVGSSSFISALLFRRKSNDYKMLIYKIDNINSFTTKIGYGLLRRPISYPFFNLKSNYNIVVYRKNYSQITNGKSKGSLIPIVIYLDAYLNKSLALKDTKNKAGVYLTPQGYE